jgi:hypothetical protein
VADVQREVQIMNHLSGHPNVVTIKGVYEDKSSVHIVMELCAGGELFDRIIAKGRYTEKDAAALIRTMLQVRAAATPHTTATAGCPAVCSAAWLCGMAASSRTDWRLMGRTSRHLLQAVAQGMQPVMWAPRKQRHRIHCSQLYSLAECFAAEVLPGCVF